MEVHFLIATDCICTYLPVHGYSFKAKKCSFLCKYYGREELESSAAEQGGQNGRICACWEIVNFEQFGGNFK
jgi:hypothetical protein